MKNHFHRFVTLAMAFLVLLSSTGFALVEHACSMRGKSVQLVASRSSEAGSQKTVSSCCAKSKALKESKGTFFKKKACCQENQKFEKIDVAASSSQLTAKLLKAPANGMLWNITSPIFLAKKWVLPPAVNPGEPLTFSCLLHGRGMRAFVQSYLI